MELNGAISLSIQKRGKCTMTKRREYHKKHRQKEDLPIWRFAIQGVAMGITREVIEAVKQFWP